MSWLYVGLAALVAVSVIFAAKPPGAPKSRNEEPDIPTVEEGTPIAVIAGIVTVKAPNVVYYGNLGQKAIKTSSGK